VRPIKALRADGMPIGELSRLCGVHIETIRYYEKIGMLPAPPRTESGRRAYGPKETRILVFIRRGRELGFTLDQIRALLALGGPGKASCAEVREIANHHIEDISAKINDLTKLARLLRKTVAQCSGGKAPDCPVLDILDVQGIGASRTLRRWGKIHAGRVESPVYRPVISFAGAPASTAESVETRVCQRDNCQNLEN
jgi:MerR family transcriptional regulator, mercuric resistance operon regulatory protein